FTEVVADDLVEVHAGPGGGVCRGSLGASFGHSLHRISPDGAVVEQIHSILVYARYAMEQVKMMMVSDAFPVFLKVEEAARILRISRTSAYEQANQWLASDGRVGLPVVRLGRSLR